jgi:hypothetical protein
MIHVQDTTAPMVVCPAVPAVEVGEHCVGIVPDLLAGVVATDGCSSPSAVVLAQDPEPGTELSVGVHSVTVTATDPSGNQGVCVVQLEVVDTQVPAIAELLATPESISPPNDKMVQVCIDVLASDNCDPNPMARLVAVLKDGDVAGADAVVTGPLCAQLRAVPAKKNTVTVYTLVVECVDASGNSSTASMDVRVENAPGKKPVDKPTPPNKAVEQAAQKPAPAANKGANAKDQ